MEFFRARLAAHGDAVGWYCWYAVQRSTEGSPDIVIGTGGYHGPPDADGVVEALVARAFSPTARTQRPSMS